MRGTVVVEEQAAFDAWLAEQMTFGQLLAQNEPAPAIQLARADVTPVVGER
jgi:cytochrome c oxidase subunit 2